MKEHPYYLQHNKTAAEGQKLYTKPPWVNGFNWFRPGVIREFLKTRDNQLLISCISFTVTHFGGHNIDSWWNFVRTSSGPVPDYVIEFFEWLINDVEDFGEPE